MKYRVPLHVHDWRVLTPWGWRKATPGEHARCLTCEREGVAA